MMYQETELASPTLAEVYYQQGEIEKAILTLEKFLAKNPHQLKTRERLKELERELFQTSSPEKRQEKIQILTRMLERIKKELAR